MMRHRLLHIAAALLLLLQGASAGELGVRLTSVPVLLAQHGGAAQSQLLTLVSAMPLNSFKRLTLASEETQLGNLLPRTKANFDSNGSTWATDAAVGGNPMAGVGSGTTQSQEWAFSGAGCSEQNGKCLFFGGGHAGSGDGTLYTFDPEAAAANINLGGSGTAWTVAQPSARYIDAFTNGRPSSAASPQGAVQIAPTTPTAANQSYWAMPNENGVAMPLVVHTYHTTKYIPGTRNIIFASGQFGFDPNGTSNTASSWVYNDSSNTVTGPLVTGSAFPTGTNQNDGYLGIDSGNPSGLAVDDVDGNVYATWFANFNWGLYEWTNALNGSLALTGPILTTAAAPNLTADAIIIPDPANPSQRIFFEHRNQSNNLDTHFYAISGLNGGTPAGGDQIYASGTITSNGQTYQHYAYDTKRKVIWMTDGNHLFKITPSAAGLASWTIAQVTGFTGDVPPDPTIVGSGNVPSLQYVAAIDALIHVQQGGVRVYKPSDWTHP